MAAMLFITALASYGISTLGWIWALRQVPLSTAYLFMSASFIIVPLGAYWFFDEPLSVQYVLGSLLIIAGVLVAATA